jgi:hypothetical protein
MPTTDPTQEYVVYKVGDYDVLREILC